MKPRTLNRRKHLLIGLTLALAGLASWSITNFAVPTIEIATTQTSHG